MRGCPNLGRSWSCVNLVIIPVHHTPVCDTILYGICKANDELSSKSEIGLIMEVELEWSTEIVMQTFNIDIFSLEAF